MGRGDILKRLISGIVAISLFLAVCFGGNVIFVVAAVVVAALALTEWTMAYRHAARSEGQGTGNRGRSLLVLNTGLAWLGVALPAWIAYGERHLFHPALPDGLLLATPVFLFALLIPRAARAGHVLGGLRAGWGLVGMVYIGALLSAFVLLRDLGPQVRVVPFRLADRGAWLILFVSVCVWASDTCAYFVGRAVGRHKLAPVLSPNKSIEGAVAGLLGALLVGAAFGYWIHMPTRDGVVIGLLAGILGPLGDLFESALKRELGIKDFGSLMPGHGGALDRIDSLLFVIPVAYLYLNFIVH
jgi:phosphatidate cytidylyltransferase